MIVPSKFAARIVTTSSRWRGNPHQVISCLAPTQIPTRSSSSTSTKEFDSSDTNAVADHCDLNMVYSPYPPVPEGPYLPMAEFVMQNWKSFNPSSGHLAEQTAIRDTATGMTRSFDDYYNIATQVGAILMEDFHIKEDECVALYCPNHVDYLPVSLAVSLTGAKLTPINPLYTTGELTTVLQKSRSSVFFVHTSKLDVALESVKDCPNIKQIIVITDNGEAIPEGTMKLSDLLQNPEKRLTETNQGMHPNTKLHPYLLPYSSGTTGAPKGVCLTHENIVVNLQQFHEVENMFFPQDHKLISPLPFFHIYAFTLSMLHCAWRGHELITSSGRFDLEEFCSIVQEHKPHRTHLVPPICLGVAKHPVIDQYDLSSLKTIISAAAPLGLDVEKAVKQRLPGICIKQGWGMSELSPLGLLNSDSNTKPGSVGPLVPNTLGKIVGKNGKSLGPNQDGELLIKGPQVMLGYLDDVDKTAECLSTSGWLRTGDVGHYDEDGYFFITDRIKELIKVRGFQVAPAELEALLLTHESVNDVAVIQIPDDASGELPRAYIVLGTTEEAQSTTEEDIKAWVKKLVAPYKRLEGGVIFTDVIPKSASGKILRRILRDEVKEEFANKS